MGAQQPGGYPQGNAPPGMRKPNSVSVPGANSSGGSSNSNNSNRGNSGNAKTSSSASLIPLKKPPSLLIRKSSFKRDDVGNVENKANTSA